MWRRAAQQNSDPSGIAQAGVLAIANNPIRWPRLIAEALAIVVSILMAFALDAAWSRHQESTEEALLSARLSEELRSNLARLDNSAEGLTSLQAHAQGITDLLDSLEESQLAPIPDSLIASLFYNPELSSLETATVDGLRTTGRISLFSDLNVSERIAVWDARRVSVNLRQQELREHFNDRLLPHLSSQIDIARFVENRDPYGTPDIANRRFPWLGVAGVTVIRNSGLLRNLVLERVLFLSALRIQVDMAAEALGDLQDAVGRRE